MVTGRGRGRGRGRVRARARVRVRVRVGVRVRVKVRVRAGVRGRVRVRVRNRAPARSDLVRVERLEPAVLPRHPAAVPRLARVRARLNPRRTLTLGEP